jgi:hypothetical protein
VEFALGNGRPFCRGDVLYPLRGSVLYPLTGSVAGGLLHEEECVPRLRKRNERFRGLRTARLLSRLRCGWLTALRLTELGKAEPRTTTRLCLCLQCLRRLRRRRRRRLSRRRRLLRLIRQLLRRLLRAPG